MSKWLELKQKIESIPEKERRKNLVGKLARYSSKTAEAHDSLVQSAQAQLFAQSVFPEEGFQRSAKQLSEAVSAARTLHKRLVKQIEAVETTASDKQFLAIDECAKAVRNNLKERWGNLLSRKITDFENLVKAASEAQLAGSKNLTETLSCLRDQRANLPNNDDAAKRIAADIEILKNSVSTLGLEGHVGAFLIAAAEGRGNPKALGDPEIVAFIDRNNLWNLLSVKLR